MACGIRFHNRNAVIFLREAFVIDTMTPYLWWGVIFRSPKARGFISEYILKSTCNRKRILYYITEHILLFIVRVDDRRQKKDLQKSQNQSRADGMSVFWSCVTEQNCSQTTATDWFVTRGVAGDCLAGYWPVDYGAGVCQDGCLQDGVCRHLCVSSFQTGLRSYLSYSSSLCL